MAVVIKPLTEELLHKEWKSFLHSLLSLKWDENMSQDAVLKIFHENHGRETCFVAIDTDTSEIVGSVRALLDHKYIRGGALAGRIEDIALSESHQGQWIWSLLIKKTMEYFWEKWCYKVTLACDEKLVGFYEKFGFTSQEIEMKMYLPINPL